MFTHISFSVSPTNGRKMKEPSINIIELLFYNNFDLMINIGDEIPYFSYVVQLWKIPDVFA